jgi:hypothetical protein
MDTWHRARAVRSYVRFLVSAALALPALGVTVLVQGGWRAAFMGFAVIAGAGALTSVISLLVAGERLASPAPRPTRGRAVARHAPAAQPRPDASQDAVSAPKQATTSLRGRGRVSSVPT